MLTKGPNKYFVIAIVIILVDQLTKLLAYQFLYQGPGSVTLISPFLKLQYVTNPGMAFGLEIGGVYGKMALTLFRIIAVFVIISYMKKQFLQGAHKRFLLCVSMILAGAIGNLVDSTFYGFFDESLKVYDAPFTLFHGKVIDMIYIIQ